ncbi:DUF1707 domain-containing protein [Kutzneria sp. 744]|uniref:DUF1707 SHOCT-like domain-containing protein n=1 Tax=Kutzneria sp. (strain 744) TaxID=345341 RepID=UPI0003EECE1A|nr:DUF1707 domain-containing protein [Kutzneria sp. 744]EWM15756.1 hypothetical protein KUTG_06060 [Kutzneria sp. 744]
MSEQPDPMSMRASDADRERVAQVLHKAMADGRLTVSELDERLAGLYKAKTFGELVPFTRDLPDAPVPMPLVPAVGGQLSPMVGGSATSTASMAIMSQTVRSGDWVVPAHYTASAFMGEVKLDLRDAGFEAAECTITATAIMGAIRIIVPPDLTVRIDGIGFMGEFKRAADGPGVPGSPVLRITGLALMAEVSVKRRPRKPNPRQLDR